MCHRHRSEIKFLLLGKQFDMGKTIINLLGGEEFKKKILAGI